MKIRLTAAAIGVALSVFLGACGGGGDAALSPAGATGTPATETATPAPASSTATAATSPTTAATAGPRINWMLVEPAGAGAVTVRIETDVPTTATLTTFRAPGEDSGSGDPNARESDTTLSVLHTLSIGTGGKPSGYLVEVADARGRAAIGSLESGAVVGAQYFGKGTNTSKVTLAAGRKAVVTWTNLKQIPGTATESGRVIVFAKKAGCTVAEACVGALQSGISSDQPGGDANGETHSATLTIPAASGADAQDYQLLIAGKPFNTTHVTLFWFFQINAVGTDVKP